MHFSTPAYLLSLFVLPLPLSASPTPGPWASPSKTTCRRGIYNSLDLCTANCGIGASAGNCSRITTELIHDARPYDCTCPGDSTPDIIDVPTAHTSHKSSPAPSSSHVSSASEPQPTAKLRPRSLADKITSEIFRVKSKVKDLKEKHRDEFLSDNQPPTPKSLFALPQQMPLCKRGYYPSVERCMANCGMRSGRCVDVGDGGLGVVACMCKTGEL